MIRSTLGAVSIIATFMIAGCGQQNAENIEIEKAIQLFEARQFEQAIPHLEIALNQPIQSATRSDILTTIGVCYYEINQLADALKYHEQAIEENPNHYQAYVNQGMVYRLMEEYDKAEQSYTEALNLAPDYAELHISMGALALYQQEHQKAITHLERAIELNDSLPTAHSNLAIVYAHAGRFDEADQELIKAVQRGYHQPEAVRAQIDNLRHRANEPK